MHTRTLWMITACLALAAAGCSSPARVTYYTLQASPITGNAEAGGSVLPTVSVGPVTLPELVDRPQLVLNTAANQVELLEMQRWAAPLKGEIARLVAGNLRRLLGSNRVSASYQYSGVTADARILLDILRFEATPGQSVTVEANWSLRRSASGVQKSGHVLVREPVDAIGYDPLVAAYSRALLAVSRDLATALRAEAP